MFAIAVIQVKPQLERVLNLPLDSLTKEIELTQDLLKLFQEYQTSADLLSFDKDLIEFEGVDGEVKVPDMIKAVRSNADKVMAMIKKEQDKQIEREKAHQAYEQAKADAEYARVRAEEEQSISRRLKDTGSLGIEVQSNVVYSLPPKKSKRTSMMPNFGNMMSSVSSAIKPSSSSEKKKMKGASKESLGGTAKRSERTEERELQECGLMEGSSRPEKEEQKVQSPGLSDYSADRMMDMADDAPVPEVKAQNTATTTDNTQLKTVTPAPTEKEYLMD